MHQYRANKYILSKYLYESADCWVPDGRMQMTPSVSTGDRDSVVRQVLWRAAVQTRMTCHRQLEKHPVGDVEPLKFAMQYLTQTAVKLPCGGDDACSCIQHTL